MQAIGIYAAMSLTIGSPFIALFIAAALCRLRGHRWESRE